VGVVAGGGALDRATTVKAFAEMWLADVLPARDLRDSTKSSYSYIVRQYVIPAWGHHKIGALKPLHVEVGLQKLIDDGKAKDTVLLAKTLGTAARSGETRHDEATRKAISYTGLVPSTEADQIPGQRQIPTTNEENQP